MTNQAIPEAAVDAALAILRRDDLWELSDEEEARLILQAAAPHMLAGILALHERGVGDYADGHGQVWNGAHCIHCWDEWPCATIERIGA